MKEKVLNIINEIRIAKELNEMKTLNEKTT